MPTITGNAAQIGKALGKLGTALFTNLMAAESENLADAKRELEAASNGTIPTAELTAMGHPFATRDPQTPIDSRIINDQGGPFAHDWQEAPPAATRDGGRDETVIRSSCENVDPSAKFMKGTRKMITRPIREKVAETIKARVAERRRDAIHKAVTRSIS